MKKTLSIIALVLATASVSMAGQAVSSKKVVVAPDDCRFRANEWQVDVSVAGRTGMINSHSGYEGIGGNLGISYFFTKYLGIGIDNSVGGGFLTGHPAAGYDQFQADLLVRYPICAFNLAPYIMVGGGSSWSDVTQGNGNLGGGLEYRFTPNVGLFADCRWLYGTGRGVLSEALPRVGLRFAF
jgi:hypothetical protein